MAILGIGGKVTVTSTDLLTTNTATENGKLLLRIQSWIGLVLVIIWQLFLTKMRQVYKNIEIKND